MKCFCRCGVGIAIQREQCHHGADRLDTLQGMMRKSTNAGNSRQLGFQQCLRLAVRDNTGQRSLLVSTSRLKPDRLLSPSAATPRFSSSEYMRIGKDGRKVWLQATYNPILDEAGQPCRVVKFATDVTATKFANAEHQHKIRAIDRSHAIIEFDLIGNVLNVNRNYLAAFGYERDEVVGRHHSIFCERDHIESDEYRAFWMKLARGAYHTGSYLRIRKDGSRVWLQAAYNPIFDEEGRPYKVVKIATDISVPILQTNGLLNDLQQRNQCFDTALANMPHGLIMCDDNDRVVVVNGRFCDIYGINQECIAPGVSFRDVLSLSAASGSHSGRTVHDLLEEHARITASRSIGSAKWRVHNDRTIAISYKPIPNGGWIAAHEDISERCHAEERIVFLAWHDELTQLPNRARFRDRLLHALANAERGASFALLFLDLDGFKAVNDTLGHPAGDSLLCEVANRLRAVVREGDTVARFGGDEFAILQLGAALSAETAALARRIIRIIGKPCEVDGTQVAVGASIGITVVPGDGMHPERLIKNADLALYCAKRDGGRRWRFYDSSMEGQFGVETRPRALRLTRADKGRAIDVNHLP
jgi:diguanylate cyclase (GGDEF)-like protein/PAS domain S-box-containing protein